MARETAYSLRKWASEMRMGFSLSSEQAPLLKEAADEIERLHRIEIAALTYFVSYCRDEAEELECCINPEQHKAAQELRDALANKRSAP